MEGSRIPLAIEIGIRRVAAVAFSPDLVRYMKIRAI